MDVDFNVNLREDKPIKVHLFKIVSGEMAQPPWWEQSEGELDFIIGPNNRWMCSLALWQEMVQDEGQTPLQKDRTYDQK